MSRWLYYFSGLLYGVFRMENGEILHRWLDCETARFGEEDHLDVAASEGLRIWASMDVLAELSRLSEYEVAFAGGPDAAETAFGRYTRRGDGGYGQRDTVHPVDVILAEGRVIAFACPSRESTAILVREGCEDCTALREWRKYMRETAAHPIRFAGSFRAVMRDGIALATDVYLPADMDCRLPTVLVRTPYGKSRNKHLYYRFAQRGYAVVLQDVRGREESEGEFIPCNNEIEDGGDTLNWIAVQPWSNGKVGMFGGSYLGYTQWAAAASGNPHLAAMVSLVTSGSAFMDIPRRGGCFVSGMLAWAFAMSERTMCPKRMLRDDWDELLNIRPLEEIPRKALGRDIPFLTKWLKHPDYDVFWRKGNWRARWVGLQVPALILSGWFDDNGMGTTEALELTEEYPAGMRKVVLGPWNHNANSRYDINGIAVGRNALRYDLDLLYFQWLDRHLQGIESGVCHTPAVEYYTLMEDRWKAADSWPPATCRPLTLYLAGADAARNGGQLLRELPADGSNGYDYDPANPATHLIDLSENEIEMPAHYEKEERCGDILCYTTQPLTEDITVTGEVHAELYASSSAVDTDFVIRITEVDEAGRSLKLADGMLSAKYRDGFAQPLYMERGGVYKLVIRTTKLSVCFQRGTRIRFTVTSSAKNFIFPNSNTTGGYDSIEVVIAGNVIHHGKSHPSHIVLPVELG